MTNPIAVIREFLLAQTSITSSVGSRIFSPAVPFNDHTFPCISFVIGGGRPEAHLDFTVYMVGIRCWGGTDTDANEDAYERARTVYQAVRDALHSKTLEFAGPGRILWSREAVAGHDAIDPDTEWRFTMAVFEIAIDTV